MKLEAIARLMLGSVTYVVVALSVLAPTSLTYRMTDEGGPPAYISLALLTVVATLVLLDMVLNPVSERVEGSPFLHQHRQFLWMLLAITYCAYAVVLVRTGMSNTLAAIFVGFGLASCQVAFADAFRKLRQIRGTVR